MNNKKPPKTSPNRKLLAAALALLCLGAAAQGREDKVQIHGQEVGTQTVDDGGKGGKGVTQAVYRYSERGRGDEIKASWTLDARGLPTHYEAKGVDYWKAPIEERFDLDTGSRRAQWHNRVDQGDQALAKPSFYLPANPPPEFQAVLARALLKAPGQTLALLPGGTARIRKIRTLDLNGQGLTLYHITGLDFLPTPVWLHEEDGSTAAVLTDWLGTLPPALAPLRETLMEAQNAAAHAWHAELARTQAHEPAGGTLLIQNARLFDPRDLAVREHMSVWILGDRIAQVGGTIDRVPDTEVIDAQGKFLMPGLWDVHQHFAEVDGVFDLIAGVTSARDMANDNVPMLARVKRFDEGTELGPRVVLAGIVEGTGPLAGPTDVRVDDLDKAQAAVDWYAEHGYQQIKIYSSFPKELVGPIAVMAHRKGLRVSGHVPAFMTARQFIEAGADEIQHLNFILLNFFPEFGETRGKDRYTFAAEKVSRFDLDDPRFGAFIELMKRRHTVLDPTMVTLEGLFSGEPSQAPPALQPLVQRFPVVARRQMLSGAVAVPAGHEAAYRQAFPAFQRMLKRLYDAGITLMPGTDAFSGYSLHRDLELYAQAGIPNAEVLRMATLVPARVLGAEFDRGVIAPGKRADMILVDGDPLKNIGDIRRIYRTIKGGRIIDPAALEQALGIAPQP